ncbi:hypothetical protein [Stenotrophomonas sp.]|uniref:hypothetical protein n=1 Tax=Stenotrophomonas sp. TaxID=69392 RepID=UPI002D51ADE3|nr:hypothetical protein [Stenotrophomonas sp.]HYQ24182.1 hypothetical protein [Stenotrophomonas sp.]
MTGEFALSLAGPAACILMTVAGLYVVRRISVRHPDGRHWLLGMLALLSPVSLLAGTGIGAAAAYLPYGLVPAVGVNALTLSALLLVLIGVFAAPISWRVVVLRRLQRDSGSLPFFRATRTQLLALFVLAAAYMGIRSLSGAVPLTPMLQPGLLQRVIDIVAALVHLALVAIIITLPLMALRGLVTTAVQSARARWRAAAQG